MFALGFNVKLAPKEQKRIVTPIAQVMRLQRLIVREPATSVSINALLHEREGRDAEALIFAPVPAEVFYPLPPPVPRAKSRGGITKELLALAAGMLTEAAKLDDAGQRAHVYDKTVDMLIDAETDDGEDDETPVGPSFNVTLDKGSKLVIVAENTGDSPIDFAGAFYGHAMPTDMHSAIASTFAMPPRTRLLPVRWDVELAAGESKTLDWTAQARGWVMRVAVSEDAPPKGVIVDSVRTEPLRKCEPGTVRYEAGDVVLITLQNMGPERVIVRVLATMEMFT